jgi:hypothetical protein
VERITSLKGFEGHIMPIFKVEEISSPADPAFFWVAIPPLGHTQKEGKRAETSSKDFWGKCPPNSPDVVVIKP